MEDSKQKNIKNPTYYIFNDRINIKHFHSGLLTIDSKSYKHNGIYYLIHHNEKY